MTQSAEKAQRGATIVPGLQPKTRWRRAQRDRFPYVAATVATLIVLAAVLGPLLASYGESQGGLAIRLVEPWADDSTGRFHPLGTDTFGRDIATRLTYGARVSLLIGVVGVMTAAAFGTAIGLLSGVSGPIVDAFLMRVVDIALSIPGLLVAILLAAVFSPSLLTVFIVIGVLLWPNYARLVRGEVLGLRESDFVALAKVAGCSRLKIARKHILPNIAPSVFVLATLHVGTAIMTEAALSFLGVGLPPDQASWGSMVNEGRGVLASAWWVPVIPGVVIFLAVLSCNILGDWARVRFDPRLNRPS